MAATLLTAIAVVAALALLFPSGALTRPVENALQRWLGLASPLLPAWLLGAGLALFPDSPAIAWVRSWRRVAGLVAISLAVPPALHFLATELGWPSGIGASAGGLVGATMAQILSIALGPSGSTTLLLLLLAAGLSLLIQPSPAQVASMAARVWRLAKGFFSISYRVGIKPPAKVAAGMAAETRPLVRRLAQAVRRSRTPLPATVAEAPISAPTRERERGRYRLPPMSIFSLPKAEQVQKDLEQRERIIEETLRSFNVNARVVERHPGPTVTQFGVEPELGVPVSRITARANDLALRLGAAPIRIEAPVPGKRVVGIEVPNSAISVVTLREILESPEFAGVPSKLRLALGRDVSGKAVVADLARMPHLLIAGATGSGKSVCLNGVIASLLFQNTPDELHLLMVDPKMVELTNYSGLRHLIRDVATEPEKVLGLLKWATYQMEERFRRLSKATVRNIQAYNQTPFAQMEPMPYLVVIVDELADLMMVAPDEVEHTLTRLAQLGRATGIHLIVATQRPSVDVVTGLIKANFPARVAFAVTSQVDSRVILDVAGAEKLLGRGDMLYLPSDSSKAARLQGTYVSEDEIERLVRFCKTQGIRTYSPAEDQELAELGRLPSPDQAVEELYDRAVALAGQHKRISISMLQRHLEIGYPRAARLVDMLQDRGIVGLSEDGRALQVLVREPLQSLD